MELSFEGNSFHVLDYTDSGREILIEGVMTDEQRARLQGLIDELTSAE